jgi:hypothetical protein
MVTAQRERINDMAPHGRSSVSSPLAQQQCRMGLAQYCRSLKFIRHERSDVCSFARVRMRGRAFFDADCGWSEGQARRQNSTHATGIRCEGTAGAIPTSRPSRIYRDASKNGCWRSSSQTRPAHFTSPWAILLQMCHQYRKLSNENIGVAQMRIAHRSYATL